jgi:hypothetical protein
MLTEINQTQRTNITLFQLEQSNSKSQIVELITEGRRERGGELLFNGCRVLF